MPRLQGRIDPDGAVITVGIEVGLADATDLRSRNQPIPPPFQTTALIDTGASRTTLHPMIAQALGLSPRGFAQVETPGQGVQNVRLYDVRITLGFPHLLFPVEVPALAPATTTVLVLIGRDILEHGTLYFDGQNRAFSLWF